MTMASENQLGTQWSDSRWFPILNASNVLEYFMEKSNPFYDRTCSNEILRMQQRFTPEQLNNMTGVEYILLHCQEPILYVIRKQNRHSPSQVTPLADYYIIGGYVYQAPDLSSVINSRLLNATYHLSSALEEAQSYSRYNPNKGYYWEFKDKAKRDLYQQQANAAKTVKREETSSAFQRQRVDMLLADLTSKFPPKLPPAPTNQVAVAVEKQDDHLSVSSVSNKSGAPPEKKPKLAR